MLYEISPDNHQFPGDDPLGRGQCATTWRSASATQPEPRYLTSAEDIVLRALRRHPNERYASAGAMKADLEHPERIALSGLCDRLQPVTRRRRSLRIARYIAATFHLAVALAGRPIPAPVAPSRTEVRIL